MVYCRYLVQAGQEDKGLVTKPLGAFVRAVGGRSAAPGGGSVAATAASLVCALCQGVPACLGVSPGIWGLLGEGTWCSGSGRCWVPGLTPVLSQGAALGCMVGLMSYGKWQFEQLDSIMRNVIPPLHQAMDELVAMVDADSRAFSSYMVRSHQPRPCLIDKVFQEAALHPDGVGCSPLGVGLIPPELGEGTLLGVE